MPNASVHALLNFFLSVLPTTFIQNYWLALYEDTDKNKKDKKRQETHLNMRTIINHQQRKLGPGLI